MTKEEAREAVREAYDYGDPEYANEIIKALEQQKTGHWIDGFGGCECSECGCLEAGYSNFCPNCGAKMAESEEV